MAFEIPLTRPLTDESRRVSLPLLPALGGRQRQTVTENQMVAAVTGGVAICDPKRAIELARKDREKGEDVIAPPIDDAKLQVLFDAVDAVRKDRANAPEIRDADRQVARRLRIEPRLVAAVRVAAESDAKVCKAGIDWTASINAQRLASVARIGSNESQLDRIPTSERRIEDLDERVEKLETGLQTVTDKVNVLIDKVDALAKRHAGSSSPKDSKS